MITLAKVQITMYFNPNDLIMIFMLDLYLELKSNSQPSEDFIHFLLVSNCIDIIIFISQF